MKKIIIQRLRDNRPVECTPLWCIHAIGENKLILDKNTLQQHGLENDLDPHGTLSKKGLLQLLRFHNNVYTTYMSQESKFYQNNGPFGGYLIFDVGEIPKTPKKAYTSADNFLYEYNAFRNDGVFSVSMYNDEEDIDETPEKFYRLEHVLEHVTNLANSGDVDMIEFAGDDSWVSSDFREKIDLIIPDMNTNFDRNTELKKRFHEMIKRHNLEITNLGKEYSYEIIPYMSSFPNYADHHDKYIFKKIL